MLEGKELEGKIGEYGEYSVDVNGKGEVEVAMNVKLDLFGEIEKLAAQTETKLDDSFVATLKKLLGR